MGCDPSQNRPSWAVTWPVADPPGVVGMAVAPDPPLGADAAGAGGPAGGALPPPGAANGVMVNVALTPSFSVSSVRFTGHCPGGLEGTVIVVFTVPFAGTT